VEDEEKKDEDDLVEPLTPTLHQEGRRDLATSVKTIITGRDLARANSIFHSGGGGHRVFSSDSDAVEEQRPNVADNPAV
jgi:hypothetical protein